MNLLLLDPAAMRNERAAEVCDPRQLKHVHQTLKLKTGDTLTVGLHNAKIGTATIRSIDADKMELDIEWHSDPPPGLPLTLIIALPRPKMLRRVIQTFTAMGVKKIYFINAWKVEKSYWQSPWLTDEKLAENAILGLEQAKDTQLPEIHLRKLFKPFVEDELPAIGADSRKLLAHPGSQEACPIALNAACTLAIGPEGGFTPYEAEKLVEEGFEPVHLGERILRVETAVPALISRLFCY